MKKILFIIWSYSLGGGAEALLTMIVNNLNPQKYQIGIIEFYHCAIKNEPVNSNIRIHEPITFEGDVDYQKKLYYVHREPNRMIRKYIPMGYDLYVSFNYQIPSFLLPEGTRNIAWIHGAVFDLAEKGIESYRYLQKKAFEKTDKIISISDITTKSIQALFPEHIDKLIEIYNAVNIRQVREKSDKYTDVKIEQPAIIWMGRLDDNKDPLRMLDIFQMISRENNSIHLYFIGKGKLESKILKKAKEYGLQEHVHLLGYVENPFPIIKQADICCMTSKSEGFPMSLLECVVLGIPFVSTEVGGARILANEESCGRVYVKDTEAVKDILELLNSSKNVVKEECEKSISRFNLDTYISKIEALFDSVLKKEVELEKVTAWNNEEDAGELEDRCYYYRFPEGLFPNGSKVILYGAGDIGTNYYNYIKDTSLCHLVAWVDASAEKYRGIGKDVKDVEDISGLEYDIILIAVMHEKISRSIRTELCKRGIPDEKILWAKPIF